MALWFWSSLLAIVSTTLLVLAGDMLAAPVAHVYAKRKGCERTQVLSSIVYGYRVVLLVVVFIALLVVKLV
jgi:hypothetical protein